MTIADVVNAQTFRHGPLCSSDITVFEAAVRLAEVGVGALAVVDGGKLVGIITDQDIMLCLADTGRDFFRHTVQGWMTAETVTCTPKTGLADALARMDKHAIRHLVVAEREKPVAVVGREEILAAALRDSERGPCGELAFSEAASPKDGAGKRKPFAMSPMRFF